MRIHHSRRGVVMKDRGSVALESLHCQPPGEIKLKMFAEGSVSGFSQSLDVIYTRNVFHETVSSSERTRGRGARVQMQRKNYS